ncbi:MULTISPECIES: hypothetical protein [Salegentibacter]|uniref:hypothetical protein n=1 Tax=Salegentibacter TaxID=143222 RepID=UPI0012E01C6C|nr:MULTISPECIES: hypothetical protein [Salegentibacter]MBO2545326.1 hypothetical protein [Salegentibacter sp. BDJ18]UBZ06325.1 hypothetical protein LDL76_13270 [Salegentibacter mishustinae]
MFAEFVPTYVKPVLMNVQSLTVKFASNAQKNVEPVPKAVKKWQLKKNVKFFLKGAAKKLLLFYKWDYKVGKNTIQSLIHNHL